MSFAVPTRFSAVRFFDAKRHAVREVQCGGGGAREKEGEEYAVSETHWFAGVLDTDEEIDEAASDDEGFHAAARDAPARTRPAQKRRRKQPTPDEDESDERVLDRETRRQMAMSTRDVEQMRQRVKARVLHSPQIVGVDENFQHLTPERPWDTMQVELVEKVASNVAPIAASMSTLKNLVMKDGLKFMRSNIELVPSVEFDDYVKRRLEPFALQVIDALMLTGIVPIAYEMDPETGQRWPYVPALGTYVIKYHTVRGARRYRFYWADKHTRNLHWERQRTNQFDATDVLLWRGRSHAHNGMSADMTHAGGVYDPDVELVHHLSHDLTSDGRLRSKVAALLETARARIAEQESRAVAVSNMATPLLCTQYNHASEQAQSRAMQGGYYTSAAVDPQSVEAQAAEIENATYVRDAAQRQVFAGMLRHFEALSGRSAANEFGVREDEYRADMGGTAVVQRARNAAGELAAHSNQYHVSSARTLANGPQARHATDYVTVLQNMDLEIFTVFGLPSDYMLGHTSARAGTDVVRRRLQSELESLKTRVSDILTHVYNALFLHEDIRLYMDSPERQQRMQRRQFGIGTTTTLAPGASSEDALLDEQDLFVAEALRRVRVTFGKEETADLNILWKAFAMGAIDQQAVCSELARQGHFDATQLCADEKPIPEEMRLMLIPEFADYIKMKNQEKQQDKQMKAQKEQQKEQMKAQKEQQTAQLRSAEKTAKMTAEVTAAVQPAGAGAAAAGPTRTTANDRNPADTQKVAGKRKAAGQPAADKPKDNADKSNKI